MSLDDITAIVRRRYETGDYGNTHFKVAPDVLDLMRQQPAPARKPWEFGDPLGDLMAIPIVLDARLPAGCWRLVDNSTGATLLASHPPTGRVVTALRVAAAVALWPFVHIADRLCGVRPAASLRAGLDWATAGRRWSR